MGFGSKIRKDYFKLSIDSERLRQLPLPHYGQSVWLDDLERNLTIAGQLARSIDDGLRGLLSNFTSLERAIRAGEYVRVASALPNRDFQAMASGSRFDPEAIYTSNRTTTQLLRSVQTTFFLSRLFPPPASFAFVLLGESGFGAGFATDTDKPAFVKRIVWYF